MVDERGARRGVLPIPDRPHLGVLTDDAKDPDTSFPPIETLLPPAGAPNVLVVLLDDVGSGAGSPVGGPVRMPTAERTEFVSRFNGRIDMVQIDMVQIDVVDDDHTHLIDPAEVARIATSRR